MVLKRCSFFLLAITIFVANISFAQNSITNDIPRFFKPSDIIFSKRMTGNAPAYEDYITKLGANKLSWHYNLVNLFTQEGLSQITASSVMKRFQTIDPNLQCAIPTYVKKFDTNDIQCRSLDGSTVIGSWETWGDIARGDVLKNAYCNLAAKYIVAQVNVGCKSFHQDAVGQNMDTLRWGGCFSDEGDKKFNEFVKNHNATDLYKEILIDDKFKFSEFLKRYFDDNAVKLGLITKDVVTESSQVVKVVDYKKIDLRIMMENSNFPYGKLLKLYRDFNAQETASHLKNLRDVASAELKRPVALSGNLYYSDQDYELYNPLDYIVTELPSYLQNPKGLTYLASIGLKTGKDTVFTLPNSDLTLNRIAFASAYALGMHMILPYDVYVGTDKPRLFIEPEKFLDITDFIKVNKTLLDSSNGLETYGNVNLSTLIKVYPYLGRIAVQHTFSNQLLNIDFNASVVIHGRELKTNARSVVGNLYFQASEADFLEQAKSNNWPVEKIINPDGTGAIFTVPLGLGELPVVSVDRKVDGGVLAKYVKVSEALISAGSNYTVGGSAFTDVSKCTKLAGELEMQNQSLLPKLGESLERIANTQFLPGLNTAIPNANAPRVKYIDYGITKSGYTTIQTSYVLKDIPVYTRITFAQTGLVASTTGSNSVVGNFYLRGDLRDQVFIGQAILEIAIPQKEVDSFIAKIHKPSVLLPTEIGKVMVSVRKNNNGGSVIHLVNWNNQPVLINEMALEFEQLGLQAGARCSFQQVGKQTPVALQFSTLGNGYTGVSLPELSSWGIISCGN